MKSTNDAWLFLIGYFISFLPPMLTFIVFIFPSKFYKEQLRKTIKAYRHKIQRLQNLHDYRKFKKKDWISLDSKLTADDDDDDTNMGKIMTILNTWRGLDG
ncbi:unnamed protein product [Rotaria sp. Silwood1]|nr:unnamed protein product [Rotaria sp. Silwood1]